MRYAVTLCLLVLAAPAFAWNATGHTVVDWITWEHMTPQARARAAALLKQHPAYERDLLDEMPEGYADPDRCAFGRAGTWPDIIRDRDNFMHNQHRGPWHYVTIPFAIGGVTPVIPPPEGEPPYNVVEAIAHAENELQHASTDAGKAIALCWLLHLVGDIHQPLHAASLYSPQFPQGDRGGNLFIVTTRGGEERNLHSFWDGLLGGYETVLLRNYVTKRLLRSDTTSWDKLAAEIVVTDPGAWARESHELARVVAYDGGRLVGVNRQGRSMNMAALAPMLPEGYEERAREVGKRRAALAGYRLAAVLNRVLSE